MPAVLPDIDTAVELITRASSRLPSDVAEALDAGFAASEGNASCIIGEILANASMARDTQAPMCQDTGIPSFWVSGARWDATDREAAKWLFGEAVRRCVASGILRPNAVDARDLDGVRRCVIDAAFNAQGLGCAPGILGVCIGGDRASGHLFAKRQLLRRLDELDSPFEAFEAGLVAEVNSLGIGPMGLGGTPTVLGVKVGTLARHPASFFVTVSYGCWALRRQRIELGQDGVWMHV